MTSLPPNVRAVKDRHGKIRYRFRKSGWKSAYIPGKPGSSDFLTAYAEIVKTGQLPVYAGAKALHKVEPRTLDDLFIKLKQSARWKQQKLTTQAVYGGMLERFLNRQDQKKRRYGLRPVDKVTVAWLDNILSEMSETPAAANNLRKALRRLMQHAVKLGWRTDNPVTSTDTFKEGPGYHTWTEDEIAQYRATHPFGSNARLVLELALNTAARRCNLATLTRDDIVDGRIIVDHAKGNNETSVPILPMTRMALEALPASPIRFLISNRKGTPYSVASLGNMMRKWCDKAGLPHCSLHGLRKATSRRVAESGGTDAEGMAITGHKKSETFSYYRAKANRVQLADRALSNLATLFDVQPENSEGNQ